MFCGKCGTQNPDTNNFCRECGKPLRKAQQAQNQPPTEVPLKTVASTSPAQVEYDSRQPAIMQPAAAATTIASLNNQLLALGIGSILLGAIAWFRYPYICGALAIVFGVIVLYKSENKKTKAAIIGVIGIIIGLASIIVDLFYLSFFP